jgi:hypothetical protein
MVDLENYYFKVLNLFLSLLLSEFDGESLQPDSKKESNIKDNDDDDEEKDLELALKRIKRFLAYLRQQLCCCFSKKRRKKKRSKDLKLKGLYCISDEKILLNYFFSLLRIKYRGNK